MAKDALGNEIYKGDVVAYGVRVGNSGALHFGVIVNPDRPTLYVLDFTWKVLHSPEVCEKRGFEYWDDKNRKYYWSISKRSCALSGHSELVKLDPVVYKENALFEKAVQEVRKRLE